MAPRWAQQRLSLSAEHARAGHQWMSAFERLCKASPASSTQATLSVPMRMAHAPPHLGTAQRNSAQAGSTLALSFTPPLSITIILNLIPSSSCYQPTCGASLVSPPPLLAAQASLLHDQELAYLLARLTLAQPSSLCNQTSATKVTRRFSDRHRPLSKPSGITRKSASRAKWNLPLCKRTPGRLGAPEPRLR